MPTSPTPVVPPTPLTMAVYAPGGSVTSIAASWPQPVVATVQASFPVACMSCGVPQETAGASHCAIGVCQLSLVAISVWPEYSSIYGLAIAPVTPKSASVGPKPLINTDLGTVPLIMKPPIITLAPVSTRARVEMLDKLASDP